MFQLFRRLWELTCAWWWVKRWAARLEPPGVTCGVDLATGKDFTAYPPPDPETVERAIQDAREGRGGTIDEILSDMDAAEAKRGWSP